MKDLIVRKYKDQNYSVLFNKKTGFFARIEEKGHEEPFWSPTGPELLDVAITNYCEKGCGFCYRQSNIDGKHMSLSDFINLINQAKKIGVLQIALGGGNPNQHPEFINFLKISRDNNIIPSYTTNGNGLTDEILKATKENCGAIALSAYKPYSNLSKIIDKVIKYEIKTNVHFVVSSETIGKAIEWLVSPPEFLSKINALVFLNYKPVNTSPNLNLNSSDLLPIFFELLRRNKYRFKIGFDSCFMSGIVSYLDIKSIFIDSCDSARFSAFISEDMKMFPCSFMINSLNAGNLREKTMLDIWMNDELFVKHRKNISENNCKTCLYEKNCKGGCVFLQNINLCTKENNDKTPNA
jgi:radical SAM protein with 4Fe4S-binding SPASM domain